MCPGRLQRDGLHSQPNLLMILVLYITPFDPDNVALAAFQSNLNPGISLTIGKTVPETAVHMLIAGRPTREDLQAHPELHTVIIPWAGLPTTTRDLLGEFPHIAVHNLHHNLVPVAELTLALLLAVAKFILPFDHALRQGDWSPRYRQPVPTQLLAGKTALILGYGAIGQRVGKLCHALDMQVLATRRHLSHPDNDGVALIHPAAALPALLAQAHVLIIALPHTPQTDGLIGEVELAALPPDAILINIGRGPIVVEKALYAALKNGRLAGAGLDVWYNYPPDEESRLNTPPANYPLNTLDNVVFSPHRGGNTSATERLRLAHLADLLNAAAHGEPMPNRIDLESGY